MRGWEGCHPLLTVNYAGEAECDDGHELMREGDDDVQRGEAETLMEQILTVTLIISLVSVISPLGSSKKRIIRGEWRRVGILGVDSTG